MDKPASPSTAVRVISIIAGFAVAGMLYLNLHAAQVPAAKPSAPAAQPASSAPAATKDGAMQALMALPELKAWSALLEQSSGGKVHGALIEYDPAPKLVAGKRYWQFSFVENGSDAAHRWESFLVAVAGDEILVEDLANDTQLTLAQWRRDKHPLQRRAADVDD